MKDALNDKDVLVVAGPAAPVCGGVVIPPERQRPTGQDLVLSPQTGRGPSLLPPFVAVEVTGKNRFARRSSRGLHSAGQY